MFGDDLLSEQKIDLATYKLSSVALEVLLKDLIYFQKHLK